MKRSGDVAAQKSESAHVLDGVQIHRLTATDNVT